jgi:hypothetical protein
MTPYPSYDPTNGTGLSALLAQLPGGSNTATILGGVAVGLAGIGAIGFAVNYMRKGGTLKGLFGLAMANADKAKGLINDLPLTAEQKAALNNPTSLLPAEAQALVANVQNPQNLINQLPVSDAVKQQISQVVPTSAEEVLAAIQDPEALKAQVQALVQAQVLAQVQQLQAQVSEIQPANITVIVPENTKTD